MVVVDKLIITWFRYERSAHLLHLPLFSGRNQSWVACQAMQMLVPNDLHLRCFPYYWSATRLAYTLGFSAKNLNQEACQAMQVMLVPGNLHLSCFPYYWSTTLLHILYGSQQEISKKSKSVGLLSHTDACAWWLASKLLSLLLEVQHFLIYHGSQQEIKVWEFTKPYRCLCPMTCIWAAFLITGVQQVFMYPGLSNKSKSRSLLSHVYACAWNKIYTICL